MRIIPKAFKTWKTNLFKQRFSSTSNGALSHLTQLKKIIGNDSVLVDDITNYTSDWTKSFSGGTVVCLPKNTDQICNLLKYCNQYHLGITPQGGNTGLVGGSVGIGDEIILSLRHMNRIISINPTTGILVCEPGCILSTLNAAVSSYGYMVPLDLGAKDSCMIGGNVSSNAGGLRVMRYGSLHSNVLEMEVVCGSGVRQRVGREVEKDNTGYALKHLFIGSEGTLGVITEITLKLAPKPTTTTVTVMKLRSFSHALSLLVKVKHKLSDILSAFEFFDLACVSVVKQHLPHLITDDIFIKNSNNMAVESSVNLIEEREKERETKREREIYEHEDPVYVLMETAGFCEQDEDRVLELMSLLMEEEEEAGEEREREIERVHVLDAVMAKSESQSQNLWHIRESITTSLSQRAVHRRGKLLKYDVSVCFTELERVLREIMKSMRERGYDVISGEERERERERERKL